MIEPWTMAEFQSRTGRCSFEVLKIDLDLCVTFADVAETELAIHDLNGARLALARAEEGYAAITQLLVHLRGSQHRSHIRHGLQKLRSRLDSLKSRLPAQ